MPRAGSVLALVLADSHVGASSRRTLPHAVRDALDDVDVVLHAGDVVEGWLLDDLRRYAPVHAVLGNNDHSLRDVLPSRLELELAAVPLAIVHDSGATAGRERRMHRRFPSAKVVVYGHSHLPHAQWTEHGQLLLNPGSSTWKRTAPTHTFALLTCCAGEVVEYTIVDC